MGLWGRCWELGRPGRGLPQCLAELNTCNADLATCSADLAACEAEPNAVFPGDGAASGPALSYTNNGDGTATDNNTLLMWEVKDNNGGIHDVDNTYTWTNSFTVFLDTLNINPCFAGHCDWRIPNVKELQSIVDYGQFNAAIDPTTFPGLTAASDYWSSTSSAFGPDFAWGVFFNSGDVLSGNKAFNGPVRAVRGGS